MCRWSAYTPAPGPPARYFLLRRLHQLASSPSTTSTSTSPSHLHHSRTLLTLFLHLLGCQACPPSTSAPCEPGSEVRSFPPLLLPPSPGPVLANLVPCSLQSTLFLPPIIPTLPALRPTRHTCQPLLPPATTLSRYDSKAEYSTARRWIELSGGTSVERSL